MNSSNPYPVLVQPLRMYRRQGKVDPRDDRGLAAAGVFLYCWIYRAPPALFSRRRTLMNPQLSTRIMAAVVAALLGLSSCMPADPLITPEQPTVTDTSAPVGPATEIQTLTSTPSIPSPVMNCFELLQQGPWVMQGAANGEAQPGYAQEINGLLQDQEVLQIIIDIHGASFAEGDRKDESAIIIDQPQGQWTVGSLA